MKKFIFGLLVGMALMLTGSVFAADIQSMIGKTIQGQFGVTVDGKSLEMPAIVVDGTSFLPVRSFGESVGYAVYFDPEGAVRLEKKAQLSASNSIETTAKIAQWEKDRVESQKITDGANAQIKAEQDAEANRLKTVEKERERRKAETEKANAATEAARIQAEDSTKTAQ